MSGNRVVLTTSVPVGECRPLVPRGTASRALRPVETHSFANGVVLLRSQRAR